MVRLRNPPAAQHGGCVVDVVLVVDVAVVDDVDVGIGGRLVVGVRNFSAGPHTRNGFGAASVRVAN